MVISACASAGISAEAQIAASPTPEKAATIDSRISSGFGPFGGAGGGLVGAALAARPIAWTIELENTPSVISSIRNSAKENSASGVCMLTAMISVIVTEP